MEEPVRRVYLLAGSLLDYLPGVGASLETPRGLDREGKRVPCPLCSARGRLAGKIPCAVCPPRIGAKAPPVHRPRHGCRPCPACEGTGWRRRRPSEAPVDEYVGEELRSENRKPPERKLWQREQETARQLDHVEFLLRLWSADESVEEAWEEARRRQFARGSYPELVVALSLLDQSFPARFSLLWRAVVLGQVDLERPERGLVRLSEGSLVELNATLHHLAHELMPSPIRLPRHLDPTDGAFLEARKRSLHRGRTPAHAAERARRDALILHQRSVLGWKIGRIARFHALDERWVKKLLSRERGAVQ